MYSNGIFEGVAVRDAITKRVEYTIQRTPVILNLGQQMRMHDMLGFSLSPLIGTGPVVYQSNSSNINQSLAHVVLLFPYRILWVGG